MTKKKKKLFGRIADDSCLFCAAHSEFAGGHAYEGYLDNAGNIKTTRPKGWLVIPHLSNCAVQICPTCLEKLLQAKIFAD